MNRDCPCGTCPEQGCGRHAECAQYMDYFKKNKERNDKKAAQREIRDYTVKAIEKLKTGRYSTANRYRPKGRW